MIKLRSRVKRGAGVGTVLYPYKYKDGQFVVSRTRFRKDYIFVPNEADLVEWVKKGYSVRMNNPDVEGHQSPSLIAPRSIDFYQSSN